MMKNNSRAQSVLEYSLIITLVIAGILIMGPYVLRSINAFFKGGDLQVEDSFREELKQGPPTGEDIPDCDCDHYEDTGVCGDGITCQYTQRVMEQFCEPDGCEEYFGIPIHNPYCVYDDRCCTPPEPTGRCGEDALYADCAYGEMEMVKECGEDHTLTYECEPDPDCIFACEGLPLHPAARWCGDEEYHFTDVPPNTQVTYVPPGGCTEPVPSVKCEAECVGELVTNGSFETPLVPNPPICFLSPLGSEIDGWDAVGNFNRIEVQRGCHPPDSDPWASQEGNQHTEVQQGETLFTDPPLQTTPGTEYEVSFYYSPRPRHVENTITVQWNENVLTVLTGDGRNNPDGTVWQQYTFPVTAQGNDVLKFIDGGTFQNDGGFIDNVSVKHDGPAGPCCPCPLGKIINNGSCPAGQISIGGCHMGQVQICE